MAKTAGYAGSSSAGGSATSAVKLDSSAGSATQPIYFSDGKPVATTYTLGKSVPSDAKFTDTTYSAATTSANGLMSSADKSKLDGIASEANKYIHPSYTAKSSGLYKITVDAIGHVSAATAVAKSDITALGIPSSDTTYSNFVKSGSGAKAGLVPAPSTTAGTTKYLREDGTWAVPPDNNTTYSNFVKSGSGAKAGLVPAPSTTAGTTKYLREDGTWAVPPDTNTTYTFNGAVSTIKDSNLTASRALVSDSSGKVAVSAVTSTELGYLDGVTSAIQTQLNGKQASITGAATTITGSNLTASRALISNSSGKVAVSAVTSTELGYLDGVTSNVQTQINTINTTIGNISSLLDTINGEVV